MCLRVKCMQRRMCSLPVSSGEQLHQGGWLFLEMPVWFFMLEVSHADCQNLQEKTKFFETGE